MSVSALFIEPRNLHSVWPFVQKGLEAIIKKTKPDWLAEDVYSAIRSGTATLALGLCDGNPIGFTVSYFNNLAFSGSKELFIWCAWTIKPRDRRPEWDIMASVRQVLAELIALGRAQGAKQVTCISPRPGFDVWSEALGFALYHKTFRLDI